MELLTPLETLCRLILRAKELEAQVPAQDPDEDPDNVDDLDAANAIATAPTNGLTAGPGTAPVAADPMATDPAYGAPAQEKKDDRFPWGLLGLLGLAGLIPRKPRERRHDGAI